VPQSEPNSFASELLGCGITYLADSVDFSTLASFTRTITRVMGLSSSEDRMIVAGVVLAWYQRVTDGRSDRQRESIIANAALCIASYAEAL